MGAPQAVKHAYQQGIRKEILQKEPMPVAPINMGRGDQRQWKQNADTLNETLKNERHTSQLVTPLEMASCQSNHAKFAVNVMW